jgi:hypothetical protein
MLYEFAYLPTDLEELGGVYRKKLPPVDRRVFLRGILGWIVLAAAVPLLTVVGLRRLTGGHPAAADAGWLAGILGWVCAATSWGAVITGYIWFRSFRNKVLAEDGPVGRRTSIEIDSDAATIREGPRLSRWEWPAFEGYQETSRGFYLKMAKTNHWIVLPKRVVELQAHELDVRAIFEANLPKIADQKSKRFVGVVRP